MTEVELKLVVNSQAAVKGVKDLQTETQKLYTNQEGKQKRQVGLIQDIENELKKLGEQQKRAMTVEHITKYNQKIAEAKQALKEYEDAGLKANQKVTSSGAGLLKAITGWAMGFATLATAAKGFKTIIESTDTLSDRFKATLNGWKEGFAAMSRAIANNDFKDFAKNVKEAIRAGQEYTNIEEEISDAERAAKMRIADRATELIKLRVIQNSTLAKDEQIAKYGMLQAEAGKKAAEILVQNSEDLKLIAEARFQNELKLAATRAGFQEGEIEQGKKLVLQYLQQDAVIIESIAIGEKYNALIEERTRLESLPYGQGKNAAKIVQEKIDAMGKEGVEYGKLARLKNIVDLQRDEIVSRHQAIEEADQAKYNLRVLSKIDANAAKMEKKEDTVGGKMLDQKTKFQELSQELIDKYDKSEIDSLSGVEKLEAQRKFGIKQIQEIRDQLLKLGELTPEQIAMLEGMAENVWKAYYEDIKKIAKNQEPELVTINTEIKVDEEKLKETQEKLALFPTSETLKNQVKSIEDHIKSLYKKREDIIINIKRIITTIEPGRAPSPGIPEIGGEVTPNDLVKLTQKRIDEIKKGSGSVPKSPSTIWDLMGINTETDEGKQIVDAAKNVASQLKGVMDDIMQRRTEDAQKRRELLDTQISEKQEDLNRETDLQKKGYANNVDLKKKELDALKVQRDKAIQDEQKAVQQQRIIESTTQAISLATSIAQIFKANSKAGTIGVILAIASVAAMIAAFASAKSKVTNATKLAKGGTGTVEGLTHSEGGEKFLDHIEVEAGERWGVLSRGASQKYGNQFKDLVTAFNRDDKKMIFTTFNKLNPELAKRPVNILNVENSGPNKRLDKVNENLEKMNTKKEQVFHTDKAIIIVRGNHVTTIRR